MNFIRIYKQWYILHVGMYYNWIISAKRDLMHVFFKSSWYSRSLKGPLHIVSYAHWESEYLSWSCKALAIHFNAGVTFQILRVLEIYVCVRSLFAESIPIKKHISLLTTRQEPVSEYVLLSNRLPFSEVPQSNKKKGEHFLFMAWPAVDRQNTWQSACSY